MKTLTKILIPLVLILFAFFFTGCPNPNTPVPEPDVTAPAAPTALVATVESDTAISLAWTDNADNETGFVVEWSKTNDFATIEDTATPDADATTLVATALDASTEYFFRVKAINSAGDSAYAETNATTNDPPVTIPAAPTALVATVESDTAISLAWTDNADNETGFVVEWSKTNDFATIEDTATPAADATTFVVTALDASTEYFFRVKAVNSAGDSAYAEASATTNDPPATIPAAPSALVIIVVSDTEMDVSWTDNSSDETGFELQWDTDNAFATYDDETPGANITTASVRGLTADTEYFFRIRAVNGVGSSDWSAIKNATTNPPPAGGTFYINANATYATSTNVTLNSNITNVVEMRFQNAGAAWPGWEPYSATKAWILRTGDGTKTVNAQFKNSVGTILNKTDTIILDTILPNASFQINAGAGSTTSTSVTLNIGIITGVNEMRFQNAGGTWSAWYSANATMAWTLSSGDGTKTVNAEFRDVAGNIQTRSDSIILDTIAPSGNIKINGGATYTTQTSVTINNNMSGATLMKFADTSAGLATAFWIAYNPTKSWNLSTTNGTHHVYAQFRDTAGNYSPIYSDYIILDTVAPSGYIQLNNGASSSTSRTVTINNHITGASQMRSSLTSEGITSAHWHSYISTSSITFSSDGTKYAYAQFKDAAGNLSPIYSDSINVDTVSPSFTSFKINNDATYTTSTSVVLNTTYSDATQMAYRFSSTETWSSWVTASSALHITLSSTDGTKYVQVKYRDAAGNESILRSDTITLDTEAPLVSGFNIKNASGSKDWAYETKTYLEFVAVGATEMRFNNDNTTWSAWEPYTSADKLWYITPGENTYRNVYVEFRDAAGNVTSTHDFIYYDAIRRLKITATSIEITDDGDDVGPGEIYWTFDAFDTSGTQFVIYDKPASELVSMSTGTTRVFTEGVTVYHDMANVPGASWKLRLRIVDDDSPALNDYSNVTYKTLNRSDNWGIGSSDIYASGSPSGYMYYTIEKVN